MRGIKHSARKNCRAFLSYKGFRPLKVLESKHLRLPLKYLIVVIGDAENGVKMNAREKQKGKASVKKAF